MRTLLCLAFLVPVLAGQETFLDADFTFTFSPPAGMVPLEEAELRGFLKLPADYELNAPLSDDQQVDLVHNYLWKDTTGQSREIKLLIGYSPKGLPWVRPEDYAESIENSAQMTLDSREPLKAPHPGIQVEGSAIRPDGVQMRRLIAYFTMGRNEYALMSLSTRASNWPVLRAEFAAVIDSVRFPMPEGSPAAGGGRPGAQVGPQQGGRGPQGSQADPGSSSPKESWNSLEVTGSLVLAVVLMMGLFAGGKRPS